MLTIEFIVSNDLPTPFRFCLEPWGGNYFVRSKGSLRVVIDAPTSPRLGWEVSEDVPCLDVYDPAGTLATVYDGETEVPAV